MKRIGVDAGGTFTDAVFWDEETGLISSAKVSSRKDDPAGAVVAAASRVVAHADDASLSDLRDLVHGTTIGTNVSLERNGPRTAILATRGFRDVLEIARLTRSSEALYDLLSPGPAPLVARKDRFEVAERIDRDGSVVTELDEEGVREAARSMSSRGISSVAVSFLYSYLNADHERRAAELIREEAPEISVSLSSEILPQTREYERTSTTALNAYLAPVCAPYLAHLTDQVQAWREGLQTWIMQSNGGVTTPQRAAEHPVNLLLSGPSGGVVAGRWISRQTGIANTITVDMGGTSFDVALLADGRIPLTTAREVMEMPVRVPTVDIETIGTGGGSIAYVDSGGQFLVGPRSAGAVPGPVCYGRGGTEPTVTDANAVLGILADGAELGDDVVVDRGLAEDACARLGAKLGLDPIETALGIRRISNAAMAGAVRAISVGRGHDPRDFALNAFGGAGPMHAADIALEMSIPTVIVPPVAGCLSAVGLVVSDVLHNHAASFQMRLDGRAIPALAATLSGLRRRAVEELADDGIPSERQTVQLALDLSYVGQNTAITVEVDEGFDAGWIARTVERFHAMHERVNGFRVDGEPIDITTARVGGAGSITRTDLRPAPPSTEAPRSHGSRSLVVSPTQILDVPLFRRELLLPGQRIEGAAVIESNDTTFVVPGGSLTRVDGYGNLLLTLGGHR
ncbi:hydantoinase/oxoprolinase family protein [Leucobacter allii]|uniref:Hydantoinase/oxoprolinase family protein n=1 Tax=Leucobacter allii TaxID=2932247 RepID=A0ABY4FIF4_9MICO|nr:hydantoinase/oxoprolinase family protein [Leucobacter allii]UOQ56451.1 hydantoinase/oxoprolinase family protein [Leucobacter allii]